MNLFQNGIHHASVGVLYPAEQEWAGDYIPIEKPIRELLEHQIDCDIISADYLEKALVSEGKYKIGKEEFEVLVVPYGEFLNIDIAKNIYKLAQNNVKVIFVNSYPKEIIGGSELNVDSLKDICSCVELNSLSNACDENREIKISDEFKDLVYYHYETEDMHSFMLFNESVSEVLDSKVSIPKLGYSYEYDAYENKIYTLNESEENNYDLYLEPYESKVIIFTKETLKHEVFKKLNIKDMSKKELNINWSMSFANSFSYHKFENEVVLDKLVDITTIEEYEDKTGTLKYKSEIDITNKNNSMILDLGEVYEVAEVFINGKSAGVRICPPYKYNIGELLEKGKNEVVVEVTNTLGNSNRDALSQYLVIEPFGLIGPVSIYEEKI